MRVTLFALLTTTKTQFSILVIYVLLVILIILIVVVVTVFQELQQLLTLLLKLDALLPSVSGLRSPVQDGLWARMWRQYSECVNISDTSLKLSSFHPLARSPALSCHLPRSLSRPHPRLRRASLYPTALPI